VAAGNEAVLRARFEDATFFYKQDLEQQLADFKCVLLCWLVAAVGSLAAGAGGSLSWDTPVSPACTPFRFWAL
jgi:hypothetical protein